MRTYESETKTAKDNKTYIIDKFYTENYFDIGKFDREYKIGGEKSAEEFYDEMKSLEYGLYCKYMRKVVCAIHNIKTSVNHENVIYLKKLMIEYVNSLIFTCEDVNLDEPLNVSTKLYYLIIDKRFISMSDNDETNKKFIRFEDIVYALHFNFFSIFNVTDISDYSSIDVEKLIINYYENRTIANSISDEMFPFTVDLLYQIYSENYIQIMTNIILENIKIFSFF